MKIGAGGLQSLAQFEALPRRGEGADRVALAREVATTPVPTDLRALVRAIEHLNRLAELFNQQLVFRFNQDQEGKRRRIRIVDRASGKTLREADPEELPDLARHLFDSAGLIIDAKK
jgi:uncharacterized FlaG/YvyC family protein